MTEASIDGVRVTCSQIGQRNDYGKEKLVAKLVPDGILIWCKYCRVAHRVTKEQCLAAWSGKQGQIRLCPESAPLQG